MPGIHLKIFCGPACLLDVRGKELITYEAEYEERIADRKIILFFTGFDKKYGMEEYYSGHPQMDMAMAEFLVRKNVKLVGLDTPSPDRYPFDVHRFLLSRDIFILENLRNLEELTAAGDFEIYAFPLK